MDVIYMYQNVSLPFMHLHRSNNTSERRCQRFKQMPALAVLLRCICGLVDPDGQV